MKREHPKERIDRELIELLNELRVALPGVQVIFAFLLTVPFTARFDRLGAGDRRVYFAAVLGGAVTSALFMAPTAHHRLQFRKGSKEQMVRVVNRLVVAGMAVLSLTMGAVVYVIGKMLYGGTTAWIVAAVVTVPTMLLWFAVPFLYSPDDDREQ